MTVRDDIEDGRRLDEIEFRVLDVTDVSSSTVSCILTVEDTAGDEFAVKIWTTHGVDHPWVEGWRYMVQEGLGKRHADGRVVLHSSADFTVAPPEGAVELLAIGDTHVGRERRASDANPPYHTARQFLAATGYAVRYGVDAVVHAGDLFDDAPTAEDRAVAETGFELLAANDVPFYYVHGNHGTAHAAALYDDAVGEQVHLGTAGHRLGRSLALFGVDNCSDAEFLTAVEAMDPVPDVSRRILVVHDEIDPPRTDAPITADALRSRSRVGFDVVLAGHLHEPSAATHHGTAIRYLGSTASISRNTDSVDRSAWLVRVGANGVAMSRVEVA